MCFSSIAFLNARKSPVALDVIKCSAIAADCKRFSRVSPQDERRSYELPAQHDCLSSTALLSRMGAGVGRESDAGERAAADHDRSASAVAIPRERTAVEHARVRERVRMHGAG